jgi:hypothetical protein
VVRWSVKRDRDLGEREGDDRNGNRSRTEKKSASAGALDYLENTVRNGCTSSSLSTTCLICSRDPAPPLLLQPNPHIHWMNTPSTSFPTRYPHQRRDIKKPALSAPHIQRPACFLPFQLSQTQIGWGKCEAEARATACPQRPAETRIQVLTF